ncbi:MAG: UDP-N-acetylmuramoyl-tripeptide--D-alanyl-D-alanine ligase [Anaerolineales bacterium]|nr:UDP-N-acetylmuramoyl-tripeptide--D-alanyl-D-alanine ligase [Anaerolineales bacterium]
MLTFGFVLNALAGQEGLFSDQVLTDAAIDSRRVIPGSMFVALQGESVDGHDFVADAFQRGAMVALVERVPEEGMSVLRLDQPLTQEMLQNITFPVCLQVGNVLEALQMVARRWREERGDLRVIGITGSVGKSTTKEMVAEVLDQRYRTIKNPGNFNNEIGLPLSLLRLTEMHERAVLEMGFYVPGEIELLCSIARPQVGVVTNISEVHLERAGTMDAIIAGKGELVQSLPEDGTAILNYDDERVRSMASTTRARVFMYGLSPEADLWASDIESLGLEGIRFILHHGGDRVYIRVPLLGRHSVHTALRAAAVGLVEGLTWDEIIRGLQSTHAQLRLVAVSGPQHSLILDDTYNAAPPSVIAALNLLAELDGRRIAVLGDMYELGAFEERGHRMVGARAAEVVDQLVTVGPLAHWIADEARRAGLAERFITAYESNDEAIKELKESVSKDDIVLIKGSRGMHMEDIVSALEELE